MMLFRHRTASHSACMHCGGQKRKRLQLTKVWLSCAAKKSAVQPSRSAASVEAPALRRCLMICVAKQQCYFSSGAHTCPQLDQAGKGGLDGRKRRLPRLQICLWRGSSPKRRTSPSRVSSLSLVHADVARADRKVGCEAHALDLQGRRCRLQALS